MYFFLSCCENLAIVTFLHIITNYPSLILANSQMIIIAYTDNFLNYYIILQHYIEEIETLEIHLKNIFCDQKVVPQNLTFWKFYRFRKCW